MFSFFKNLFSIKAENTFKVADEVKNQVAENVNISTVQNQLNQYTFGMSYSDIKCLIVEENNLSNKRLIEKIEPRLLPEDREKIKNDYDFLNTYDEAVKISAKKKNSTIDEILSELILKRIKEKNELEKIVYNEAVKTIEKLTINQLNILAIVYIIRATTFTVNTIEEFINSLDNIIKPFIDFEENLMDSYHIEFAQCASIMPLLQKKSLQDFFNKEKYLYLENVNIIDLLNTTETGKKLINKWKNPISFLKPTSVGQVVASNYIKIKTGMDVKSKFYK